MLAVSLALAAGIPLVWVLTRPPRDAGLAPDGADGPSVASGEGSGSAEASPPRLADESPAAQAPPSATATTATSGPPRPSARSARISDFEQGQAPAPQRLSIPATGIDAPVIGVGVQPDGEMEVPDDVRDVGWYRHGPAPGQPGTAVLAAHVDSRQQGRGAFFDLRRLDVQQIVVTDDAGGEHRFVVVARRTYAKEILPADELFSRGGPPRLALITCGGDFDAEASSYRDNVVISAAPAGDLAP